MWDPHHSVNNTPELHEQADILFWIDPIVCLIFDMAHPDYSSHCEGNGCASGVFANPSTAYPCQEAIGSQTPGTPLPDPPTLVEPWAEFTACVVLVGVYTVFDQAD